MSAVAKSRRADKAWAAKVVAWPDQELLAPARPPGCGSSATAQADSDTSQRAEGHASASHPPASSSSTDAHAVTASAATPPANPAGARDHANSDLEARIALEYERACYKQAEARVRARLHKLQLSVNEAIEAVERRTERASRPVRR